jgi:hypothetical protein
MKCLPSKGKALSSILSTEKRRRRRRKPCVAITKYYRLGHFFGDETVLFHRHYFKNTDTIFFI